MQDMDEKIDLDALFDSLNIGEALPGGATEVSKDATVSLSKVKAAEIQELSSMDSDIFLFDIPADQS
jgi:hypothetical protein